MRTSPPTVPGYRLHEILGSGGYGEVWRATRLWDGRPVALKRYHVDEPDRATSEAETLQAIRHPNVVEFLDVAMVSSVRPEAFLVMELVDGVSLERIASGRPLPPRRIARIGRQLASALWALHAAGRVHADIKPANVMLRSPDQEPVLVDLGISSASGQVRSGSPRGTEGFRAPEQSQHGRAIDQRTDLYSLGCVLLFALTGEKPAEGGARFKIREALLAFQERLPGVPAPPAGLVRVISRCLEDLPEDRYPNAGVLYADLDALLDDGEKSTEVVARDQFGVVSYGVKNGAWNGVVLLTLCGVFLTLAAFLHRLDHPECLLYGPINFERPHAELWVTALCLMAVTWLLVAKQGISDPTVTSWLEVASRTSGTVARFAIENAIELCPSDLRGHVAMARLSIEAGDVQRADCELALVLKEAPSHREALFLRSQAMRAAGRHDQVVDALRDLGHAIPESEASADSRQLAEALVLAARDPSVSLEGVLDLTARAISRDPTCRAAFVIRSEALRKLGETAAADTAAKDPICGNQPSPEPVREVSLHAAPPISARRRSLVSRTGSLLSFMAFMLVGTVVLLALTALWSLLLWGGHRAGGIGVVLDGTRIRHVIKGAPADIAGLRSGDVIVAVDDAPVASLEDLQQRMWRVGSSSMTKVSFVREGSLRFCDTATLEHGAIADIARRSAEAGDPHAMLVWGAILVGEGKYKAARPWIQRAEAAGEMGAKEELSRLAAAIQATEGGGG